MNTRPSGLALWTASGVRGACVFPAPVPRGILLMEAPAGVAYRRMSGGGGGDSAYWCISRGRQGGEENGLSAHGHISQRLWGGGGANGVQFPGEEGGEAAYRLSGVLSGRGGLAYRRIGEGGGGGKRVSVYLAGKGGGVPARKMQYVTYVYGRYPQTPVFFFLLGNILDRFLLVF